MKRNKVRGLRLNRETLHQMGMTSMSAVAGGAVVVAPITTPVSLNCTNVLSVCFSCTTPLDGCPPVYTTPAYTCV
jgi:hypothetical protein